MTAYPDLELYIDGHWKRADGQPVVNPADESVLGAVPTATIGDLNDAIGAAERGNHTGLAERLPMYDSVDDAVAAFERDFQRLLDNHVLAGVRRRHRGLHVRTGRRRDDDDVDVAALQHLVQVGRNVTGKS